MSSDDVSTVLFGLDGVHYEVDLSEANADRLRNVVADYVASARRTGGRIKQGTRPALGNGAARSSEASQIRQWAQGNGIELAARDESQPTSSRPTRKRSSTRSRRP